MHDFKNIFFNLSFFFFEIEDKIIKGKQKFSPYLNFLAVDYSSLHGTKLREMQEGLKGFYVFFPFDEYGSFV